LVELPNELILNIVAAVEFSLGDHLNISMINHNTNELMAKHRGGLLEDIAILQFSDTNYLLHYGPHIIGSITRLRDETQDKEQVIAT
jgi:hypothetical protein